MASDAPHRRARQRPADGPADRVPGQRLAPARPAAADGARLAPDAARDPAEDADGVGAPARRPAQPRAAAPGDGRPGGDAARRVLRGLGPGELRGPAPAPRADRPAGAREPAHDLPGRPRPGRGGPEARRVAAHDADRPAGDAARQQQRRHPLVRRGAGPDARPPRRALRGRGPAGGAPHGRPPPRPGGRLRGGAAGTAARVRGLRARAGAGAAPLLAAADGGAARRRPRLRLQGDRARARTP